MPCLRVRDLLPEFALDVLDPAEARMLDRHLEGCAGCRKEAEEFREGAARLAFALPNAEPGPQLGERVVDGVSAARPRDGRRGPRSSASRRTLRVVAAAGLAAAILAGGSFSWALAMRGQVQQQQQVIDRRAATVVELQHFIAAFLQQVDRVQPAHTANNSKFFGALLSSPAGTSGSGELLVFSIPGDIADFVHMQVNLPPTAKGPFKVLFEQGTVKTIKAGGLIKTPNGDYVLSPKDPRFFDEDLSHLTGVVVLDGKGTTILTGAIQLITTPGSG
jgi:hypothetical protein